jgi:hypothetical protein
MGGGADRAMHAPMAVRRLWLAQAGIPEDRRNPHSLSPRPGLYGVNGRDIWVNRADWVNWVN